MKSTTRSTAVQGRSRSPVLGVRATLILACAAAGVTACAGHHVPPPAAPPREPRIALVLGGGAARGFAHAGVIRVLAEEKIPIAMVVGTSAGSLIGALYTAGAEPFDLEWTSFKLERDDIFDYSVFSAWKGPIAGDRLEQFVEKNAKVKNVEETRIPFYAVAADLATGERVVLDSGSLGRAVRASSAIPGVFQPVAIGDRMLVDGGVVDTIPTDVARERGADIVIAVDIGRDVSPDRPTSSIGVVLQSVSIMAREIGKAGLARADVVITPMVGTVGSFDFNKKKECVEAGIAAAREAMPRVRAAIAAWKKLHEPG